MRFSDTHEWVQTTGTTAIVGITNYAQKELGDIVYVELPKIGKTVQAKEVVCVLESTKAAADVYSPVSGKIIAVNDRLKEESELVNKEPENSGWLYKIELSSSSEVDQLMDESAYKAKYR